MKLQDIFVQIAQNPLHIAVFGKELLIFLKEGQLLAQALVYSE